MRVLVGRAEDIDADRAATRELFEFTADTGEPGVRAWTPHRQVTFGRRDARTEGYDRAKQAAAESNYPTVERRVGGRAVAYTGQTVAFARTEPVAEDEGIGGRYARATTDLQVALHELGVRAREGEPPDSFCPGSHSLQAGVGGDGAGDDGTDTDGAGDADPETGSSAGKIVGIAQRVTRQAALVAGIVVARDREELGRVLESIYDALDIPFDPDSVGSLAAAGSEDEPETVVRAVESALMDGASRAVGEKGDTEGIGEIERRELYTVGQK